jgi:uncharacterized membrane protein SpoIIM required for sporulation
VIGAFLPVNSTQLYFNEQLRATGVLGAATSPSSVFTSILFNNLAVLAVCLVLSFFYGAGSVLYLTLNASAWGIFFGYIFSGPVPNLKFMLLNILRILPHTIAEALSYIFIVIAGAVLSAAVIRERVGTKKFKHVLTDALIFAGIAAVFIVIAAVIEVF